MINSIIEDIVKVNVNYNSNLAGLLKPAHTLLVVFDKLRIKNDDFTQSNTIKVLRTQESTLPTNMRIALSDNIIKISKTFDTQRLVWDDTVTNKQKELLSIQNFIFNYFKEGGENLHLAIYDENSFAIDDSLNDVNYKIVATINANSYVEKINKFVKANVKREFFYVVDEYKTDITYDKVFKFENINLSYLALPCAYLQQITLDNQVKDFCYTKAKVCIPYISQNLDIQRNDGTFTKNTIMNIAGQGIVFGGELVNGKNLVNEYILDLFKEKLKVELFNELAKKPSRSEINIRLQSTLTQMLENLFTIGAINTDIYKGSPLIVNYNGREYEVATDGDVINKGYRLHIVDILDATDEDKKNHNMTPITILLIIQNQIRFISLDMEVL